MRNEDWKGHVSVLIFIYFLLCWVFIATLGFSRYSGAWATVVVASLALEHRIWVWASVVVTRGSSG